MFHIISSMNNLALTLQTIVCGERFAKFNSNFLQTSIFALVVYYPYGKIKKCKLCKVSFL